MGPSARAAATRIVEAYGAAEVVAMWLEAEERLDDLERKVAALTDAVHVLVEALEGTPTRPTRTDEVAQAARRAHELLLVAHAGPSPRP